MTRNESYWQRRAVQRMFEHMQSAEDTADQIARLYQKASRYLSIQAEGIFEKYKTKYGLTEAEARRLLNTLQDQTSLDELLQKLRNGDTDESRSKLIRQLEAPAYAARLERLRQLQNQLDLIIQQVYRQEKNFSTSFYTDFANEAYYRSVFDIQQRAGYGFSFAHIDRKQIDQVVGSKWSGKNYSARIWGNTQALAQDLKEELLISLVTGRTEREVSEILANKFGQGASNARRLVRTESCYLSNQMEMKSYEECGIEKYRYLATLDLRTSDVCRTLDHKVFPVAEQQTGKNCPPMHPWCRSTTTAYIRDEELARMERAARDPVTGRPYYVPADMSYQEWYAKYVEGKPEAEAAEQKERNCASDRKQHERYRELLGDEVPESFAKFQEMKYNEPEKWNSLKASFRKKDNRNTSFESLQEPLQLQHVRKVLSGMGIDYGDAKIKIIRDSDLVGRGFMGWTNPNGREVQLYPDAFSSREELVKTLGHERVHLEQLKLFGPARNDSEAVYYEQGPRMSEEYWWEEYRRRTGYGESK